MPTMVTRIAVPRTVYAWVRLRSGLAPEELERKFPNSDRWESGNSLPTLKQLESLAQAANTPIVTLAHELAHVWLGESGIGDIDLSTRPPTAIERWCNALAAEMLVPSEMLSGRDFDLSSITDQLESFAVEFKVSTLVALCRLRDIGQITWSQFREHHDAELARVVLLRGQVPASSGGKFDNTQPVRTSKRFTRAVLASTVEGRTTRRDAYQMVGFKKSRTFDGLAHRLGVT